MKRVLLIACSQRKLPDEGLLPAIERYDGPAFRVLRKFLRDHKGDALKVYVLSAKYGLISSTHPIPDYDFRLSKESAKRLRAGVSKIARDQLVGMDWESVGICASKDYSSLLDVVTQELSDEAPIDFICGGQGPRLTALKRWLQKSN